MKIGFAIIAEDTFLKKIIEKENKYHDKWGFQDRLGMEHNLPHTTIFQGDMDESIEYEQIAKQIAAKILDTMPQRELEFTNIVYVPEGWYFWECIKSPELVEVHNYTLSMVEPYIIRDPKRLDGKLDYLTKLQIDAIKRYDYRYAGEAFYPHITLGRSDDKRNKVLNMLRKELPPQKTYIGRVTVYKMGNNGTHRNTLFEMDF